MKNHIIERLNKLRNAMKSNGIDAYYIPSDDFHGSEFVSEYFKNGYTYTSTVVNNTERFKPSELAKKYKKLSDYAIADKAIIYPYWENASRITEFRLAGVYYFRRLTYIIPILTLLLLIVIGWRTGGRLRKKITAKISDTVTKVIYRRSIVKKEKKEQKEQQKILKQSKE